LNLEIIGLKNIQIILHNYFKNTFKMNDFQNALSAYQDRSSSLAQQSLEELDQVKSSKAALLQGDASSLTGKTGTIFSDKVKEEAQKIQSELGLDLSAGGLAPTMLKVGSYLAKTRASQLNSKWKDVNAERFNEKENQANEPEEPKIQQPAEEEPMPSLSKNANEMELQEPEPAFDPKLFKVPEPEVQAPEPEISETSFMDKLPTEDEIGKAPNLSGIEEEGSGLAEDLAPEITSAASLASQVGDTLLSAIPVVGGIASLAGIITGGIGLADTIKDENTDPYASIQGKLNAYQQKIGGLENQVSADQFESKLGAGMPRFGSLSVPQADTAQMSNVALHS
jgi:hypothetical protein